MRRVFILVSCSVAIAGRLAAQTAVDVPRPEEKQKEQHAVAKQQEKKAQRTSTIEFEGERTFKESELRSQLKEQIATINDFGLTAARADDLAFFLEVFYRKHGFVKVSVRYQIESGDRLRLVIEEGSVMTMGTITFDGNVHEPAEKLFEFAVGPTRQRYSKMQKNLPFVDADMQEGADLVHRLYIAEGFLDATVDKPRYKFRDETSQVDVVIPIHEGRQYFFGDVSFTGPTIYGPEALRGQLLDLLKQPYTDARVADIPRRLQAYFKARGYYDVKVEATGEPTAAKSARVPVQVAIAPGPVYHFGEASVSGLTRLHPSYVTKRFSSLSGKTYSPDVLDEKFRTLMRTGLFNLLQIKPTPENGDSLRLDITAEEAKSKEFGLSAGYGTYEGLIGGVQLRERDLFGIGRPITFSVEVSQRSYKGEILYEDPFLFDSEYGFKSRLGALAFDFDGYSKFELGGRIELSRKLTKQYEVGAIFAVRHVEITSADIKPIFLGPTSYFVNSIGLTQTLDLRESPLVSPRGLVIDNTLDVATNGLGSDIEFVRGTGRLSYYLPFSEKSQAPGVALAEDPSRSFMERWFRQTLLAFGARLGLIHPLGKEDTTGLDIPIDERFFNGGSTTVRSFGERTLGPHDRHGNPIGGEFFTVFNAEYTFPIYGELHGAVFVDAGNLLPTSENPGLDDMRYALGAGLRYKLPIGPIRLDYGVNPDKRADEDFGAFHFSFGFAF
jgi:outer membrane protein assembly complex protein YaeT